VKLSNDVSTALAVFLGAVGLAMMARRRGAASHVGPAEEGRR
jgi:hypothetical protein